MIGGARPAWSRAAGWIFVALVFGFLAAVLLRDLRTLRGYPWTVRPGMLLVSLALQIGGLAWGVRTWQLVLRHMGHAAGWLDLARVRILSGLGRYVPGKIWAFAGAANLGSGLGLPGAATVVSLLLHAGFNGIAALIVGAVLLPGGAIPAPLRWALLASTPLALLLAHPRLVALGMRTARAVPGITAQVWHGSWADNLGLVARETIGWLLSGVGLYTFVLSLTPLPAGAFTAVLGINAGAFVIGSLVLFAPAGLGAKEGTAAALFALYVPVGVGVLLAVATRLWSVLGEGISAAALLALRPARAAS